MTFEYGWIRADWCMVKQIPGKKKPKVLFVGIDNGTTGKRHGTQRRMAQIHRFTQRRL